MKSLGTAVMGTVLLVIGVAGARAEDAGVRSTRTGLYIGATAGGGWGESRQGGFDGSDHVTSNPFHIDGLVGGATIGYNLQVNRNWVVGIEADISSSSISGKFGPGDLHRPDGGDWGCDPSCVTDVNWFGTVRGRIGYAYNALLAYGTGGLAYGEVESGIGSFPKFQISDVNVGWTIGGGFEYAFAPNWSAKVEYLHVDLGWTRRTLDADTQFRAAAEFDVMRVGLNYRFGGSDRAPPR